MDRGRVEVDEEVAVTATVTDDETPIDQLTFEWTAEAGTFAGTGRSVKWKAPKDLTTPRDYLLLLKVIERYGIPDASGQRQQNTTTATSPAVRVHDSTRENSDLALRFLTNFANSSVLPSACLSEFAAGCQAGREEEFRDIEANRIKFLILSSRLNTPRVRVAASRLSADIDVGCWFESKRLACLPDDGPNCRVGVVGTGSGTCRLTSVYEERRWALCTSNYVPDPGSSPSMVGFFGR